MSGISLVFDYELLGERRDHQSRDCLPDPADGLASSRQPAWPTTGPDALDLTRTNLVLRFIRVEGSPGSEATGGDRAEPGAELRGWITVHRPTA